MPEIKKYLNRDGLEEYNSLLPHSSAEMQTYVNDWLDEHPEATTTVQDGAITEPKLADKSVSLRTLADDTVHMLKGAILTGNISGEVLTADDAYSAPPMALTVEGKSTQDGTPTPDAPIEIQSVVNPVVTFAGKNLITNSDTPYSLTAAHYATYSIASGLDPDTVSALTFSLQATVPSSQSLMLYTATDIRISTGEAQAYFDENNVFVVRQAANIKKILDVGDIRIYSTPYTSGSSVITEIDTCQVQLGSTATAYEPYEGHTVQLYDGTLRSLPDGTKDTLSLSYLRPSTREGWAWYSRELVRNIDVYTFPEGFSANKQTDLGDGWYRYTQYGRISNLASNTYGLCDKTQYTIGGGNTVEKVYVVGQAIVIQTQLATGDELRAAFTGGHILYNCTPITTTLNPIELPVLPAPECTVWSDPSTGLTMEYVRDANIVIQNIEQAIADL